MLSDELVESLRSPSAGTIFNGRYAVVSYSRVFNSRVAFSRHKCSASVFVRLVARKSGKELDRSDMTISQHELKLVWRCSCKTMKYNDFQETCLQFFGIAYPMTISISLVR